MNYYESIKEEWKFRKVAEKHLDWLEHMGLYETRDLYELQYIQKDLIGFFDDEIQDYYDRQQDEEQYWLNEEKLFREEIAERRKLTRRHAFRFRKKTQYA